MGQRFSEVVEEDWVSFPGGELEGKRPGALCAACREALRRAATSAGATRRLRSRQPICFQCYRADLERNRAMKAAADLQTTSQDRFQYQLPLEPLNQPRLEALKTERAQARADASPYADRRRHAQIEARHALARIADGLRTRGLAAADRQRAIFQAVHAAELQLPDSWLPFVVAR